MKNNARGVLLLSVVLMLNIVFTQRAIHHYYYEDYQLTIGLALLNLLIFPVAVFIYKREIARGQGEGNK